ncbi:MAG: class I SAM-dependent methyltransferase [Spirochaetia bacterium]|nr:class I SAM-dependent methyltransferase [Spirochaetia bacterium]
MPRFSLPAEPYLHSPEKKTFYNAALFREVAPRYAFATRALSLFQESRWKRDLVNGFLKFGKTDSPHLTCLDLACGTGDIAFLLSGHFPKASVTGADLSPEMLAFAKRNAKAGAITWMVKDMNQLDFPPHSLDLVTGGYALRNAPDLDALIQSLARIMKPGAVAGFLDFSRGGNRFFDRLEYWILKIWGGFWGILLHGNPKIYTYIAESLRAYPDRHSLIRLFEKKGFVFLSEKRFFFGITANTYFKKN